MTPSGSPQRDAEEIVGPGLSKALIRAFQDYAVVMSQGVYGGASKQEAVRMADVAMATIADVNNARRESLGG